MASPLPSRPHAAVRAVPVGLLAALFLLAGCAVQDADGGPGAAPSEDGGTGAPLPAGGGATARFVVERHGTNESWNVPFDPASRPAASAYEDRTVQHPDRFTAHDLLVVWAQGSGGTFETTYFDGLGYGVQSLQGLAAQDNGTEGWFWQLVIDGASSQEGISTAPVEAGDEVRFVYTHWP